MKWIFIFIFFYSIRIEPLEFDYFIVWNVGQGLWQSYITPTTCYHFDMGGEKAPWTQITSLCKTKKNIIRISHWDWDHYGFLFRFYKNFPNSCFTQLTLTDPKIKNNKFLKNLNLCDHKNIVFQSWMPKNINQRLRKKHGSNLNSEVIIFKEILMTGDSPKEVEAIWSQKLDLKMVNKIIVGHHGSKTSTSFILLNQLSKKTDFFVGIVSARKKRYGHPHWTVEEKFKSFKAPLLSTEKWGHFIYRY